MTTQAKLRAAPGRKRRARISVRTRPVPRWKGSGPIQRANEGLRALLGDDRVGRADAHPLARGRLHLWIRKNQRFLEALDGRFRIP